jgi:protein O-mannosyl-transferase
MQPSLAPSRWNPWLASLVLALAALLAYANTFSAPFIFDDFPAITRNPTIRHLSQIGTVLSPSATDGSSVSGRPIVNLSLAIDYAISELRVWSYHATNLLIHILAVLTLFGIVRRTLQKEGTKVGPAGPPSLGTGGPPVPAAPESNAETDGLAVRPYRIAFVVALLWAVHPLLTESVTCVVQRTESLMGLFYLLTLYGFIRGAAGEGSEGSRVWLGLSWLACLVGVATKEVMVTAPVLLFLYDRTFVAGTFAEAWRRRRLFYLALGLTWVLLAALLLQTGGSRGIAAGFGLGVTWWQYALTQCLAVVLYLKLALWPHPLAIDYGGYVVGYVSAVWPQMLLLAALLAAEVWALVRKPAFGFIGAWFFVILAPSSSVVPLVTQTIAEHRMYLPLVSVLVLGVLGLEAMLPRRLLPIALVLALGLGALTVRRNHAYRTEVTIWSDAAAKQPLNARAHNNLGAAWDNVHENERAMQEYRESIRRWWGYSEAHNNLGNDLVKAGRLAEGADEFAAALATNPKNAEAAYNLGNTLVLLGRRPEAIDAYRKTVAIKPGYAEAHANLGLELFDSGQIPAAFVEYREALRLDPKYVIGHYDLGAALAQTGHMPEAAQEFAESVRLDPHYAKGEVNLGNALFQLGRLPEAVSHYEAALRIEPDNPRTHYNLANTLLQLGQLPEAKAQYEAALRLKPDFDAARTALERWTAGPGATVNP